MNKHYVGTISSTDVTVLSCLDAVSDILQLSVGVEMTFGETLKGVKEYERGFIAIVPPAAFKTSLPEYLERVKEGHHADGASFEFSIEEVG